ncbi:hypothetical protein A4A49_57301, partial [Nicotiana attenuata]
AYTKDGESKKSGSDLFKGIPQKGHQGFGCSSSVVDLLKDLKSEGYPGILKKDAGANVEAHL